MTSDLTEADPEGEAAAIDSQFAPEDDDDTFSGSGTKDDPFTTDNRDEVDRNKTPDIFDEQGNLRSTLKPDEEEAAENSKRQHVPMDADHPDYFKSSRRIAFSDAWSLLKSQ